MPVQAQVQAQAQAPAQVLVPVLVLTLMLTPYCAALACWLAWLSPCRLCPSIICLPAPCALRAVGSAALVLYQEERLSGKRCDLAPAKNRVTDPLVLPKIDSG